MESFFSRHRIAFIVLSVLVLVTAERAYRYVNIFGVFRTIETVYPGKCQVLEGDYFGSEDITLGPGGSAIASTGGLDAVKRNYPHLYKGDKLIKITGTKIEDLELVDFKHDFVPHGIDLKQIDKDHWLLFAVNHRSDQDYVEMFDWYTAGNSLKLNHYGSVSVTQLGISGQINDVTIISRTSFYVTNDKFYNAVIGRISQYLGLPVGKLVFYKDGKATDVSRGYVEANGVSTSPSGERLFFTDLMSNVFYEFKINPTDGSLTLLNSLFMPTSPDNINVISENEMLIGCHVRLHDLFIYFADMENLKTASHLIRVYRKDINSPWQYETILMDDGSIVKGSSVGVYSHGNLYMGTVIEKIAYCTK